MELIVLRILEDDDSSLELFVQLLWLLWSLTTKVRSLLIWHLRWYVVCVYVCVGACRCSMLAVASWCVLIKHLSTHWCLPFNDSRCPHAHTRPFAPRDRAR